MKFDVIVGNPPYEKGASTKFLQLSTNIIKSDGDIAMITSASWVSGKGNDKFRKYFNDKVGISYMELKSVGTFTTTKDNGKDKPVLLQFIIVVCSPTYSGPTTFRRNQYQTTLI